MCVWFDAKVIACHAFLAPCLRVIELFSARLFPCEASISVATVFVKRMSDIICLIVVQAARTFLSSSVSSLEGKGVDINDNQASFIQHYLNKAISLLICDILGGETPSPLSLSLPSKVHIVVSFKCVAQEGKVHNIAYTGLDTF